MEYLKRLCISFLLFFTTGCHSSYAQGDFLATFNEPKRLLLLDGDDGTVACRVYGHLMSATIPRVSDNWTLESATRSLLRMQNLTAVRGVPGASMVGPVDYLGNLEEPHKYLYTIKNQFPPLFYRKLIPDGHQENDFELKEFDPHFLTVVKANWISGKEEDVIREKKREYEVTQKHLRQSLFLDPGLLEIDRNLIELRYFDPRGVDLSTFKARLVVNHIPFQITKKKLPSKDDYRLVTYLYEPLYADWQIQNGSGLFLEQHRFSQTITPLTPDSGGYVVLARTNENPDELELIGIQIPYSHTLVIEEGCIHGDTTLNGFFMMGMTSDHTTMRTADTVFLKYPQTKENVRMVLMGTEDIPTHHTLFAVPPPYIIYKNASEADRSKFQQLTYGQNFIFNPFSREYWGK
ncbi:MAG TPA: hypothetical protein VLE95_03160 [Chlamydiales bacterium]|nr:hypothetical protein [Chlamydiales bacterium]